MANRTSKGNYYKKKTKEMYEALGYTVQITEFMCGMIVGPGKVVYKKIDVFGSDGIAMNGTDIIFWNSKSTDGERSDSTMISETRNEFMSFPFPSSVKLQCVIWRPRQKAVVIDILK